MSHQAYKATPTVCAKVMAYHLAKRELTGRIKVNRYDNVARIIKRRMLKKAAFCDDLGISQRLYDYIVERDGVLKENVRRYRDPHQGFNVRAGI